MFKISVAARGWPRTERFYRNFVSSNDRFLYKEMLSRSPINNSLNKSEIDVLTFPGGPRTCSENCVKMGPPTTSEQKRDAEWIS